MVGEGLNCMDSPASMDIEALHKAAEQGYAKAQYELARRYQLGIEITRDLVKAVEWYQKAAVQGDSWAQYELGQMYAKGRSLPQDLVKAVEWYQKAAAQGDSWAQYELGRMYAKGQGVPWDYDQAVEWFRKAAEQGHDLAQSGLQDVEFEQHMLKKSTLQDDGSILVDDEKLVLPSFIRRAAN